MRFEIFHWRKLKWSCKNFEFLIASGNSWGKYFILNGVDFLGKTLERLWSCVQNWNSFPEILKKIPNSGINFYFMSLDCCSAVFRVPSVPKFVFLLCVYFCLFPAERPLDFMHAISLLSYCCVLPCMLFWIEFRVIVSNWQRAFWRKKQQDIPCGRKIRMPFCCFVDRKEIYWEKLKVTEKKFACRNWDQRKLFFAFKGRWLYKLKSCMLCDRFVVAIHYCKYMWQTQNIGVFVWG